MPPHGMNKTGNAHEIDHVSQSMLVRLLLVFVCFSLPIIIFAKLADKVHEHENFFIDIRFMEWLHQFASPLLDKFALVVTTLGDPTSVIVLTLVCIGYLLYLKHRRAAVFVLFGVGGSAVINLAIKSLFQRPRPTLWMPLVVEKSYSFPSGHAMASSALALSAILLLWPTRWRWYAVVVGIVYGVLIGLSRLYLGVHFPSDVIAGWCVSIVWVLIVKMCIGYITVPQRWHQSSPEIG